MKIRKKNKAYETAGARAAQASTVGDKTVITEARQLEYREFRHGGRGGLSKTLFPSTESISITTHAGLFHTIQKHELKAQDDFSTCCGRRATDPELKELKCPFHTGAFNLKL